MSGGTVEKNYQYYRSSSLVVHVTTQILFNSLLSRKLAQQATNEEGKRERGGERVGLTKGAMLRLRTGVRPEVPGLSTKGPTQPVPTTYKTTRDLATESPMSPAFHKTSSYSTTCITFPYFFCQFYTYYFLYFTFYIYKYLFSFTVW